MCEKQDELGLGDGEERYVARAAPTSTTVPAPGSVAGSALTAPVPATRLPLREIACRASSAGERPGCSARSRSAARTTAGPRRSTTVVIARSVVLASRSESRSTAILETNPMARILGTARSYADDADTPMTDDALTPRERRLRRGLVALAMLSALLVLAVITVLIYWHLYLLGPSGDPFTRGPFVTRLDTTGATLAWSIEGGRGSS